MAKSYEDTSGYCSTTAIGRFYNRDSENFVGFEMRMTSQEYHSLARFVEQIFMDGVERGRQALARAVREVLPDSADDSTEKP